MPLLLQEGNHRRPGGFSLIELIAVVLLLSVLGVVALGRLGGADGYQELGFFNETVNGLRYAQKRAMATGCRVQARLTASGWSLFQGDSCTSTNYSLPVADPASRSQAYARSAPAGVTLSPAANLVFTPLSTVEGIAGDMTFSIGGRSFTVHRQSGLIDAL